MSDDPSLNSLTVIIPTYNREKVLAQALDGYMKQSSPQFIHELLVVDDGSTDNTESMVKDFSVRSRFPIRYLRQPNKGPAAARNWGIREAGSALVLFTDSDIIPERDLVKQHVEWHRRNSGITTAVLGYVTWAPDVNATPFMRWYGEYKLFSFGRLRNKPEADFHSFYTCNLSLKTEFLRTCGQFDEEFKSAAYEDTELGYRLSEHGLRLLHNPAAIGYHHQFFSFEDACRKMRANAAAAELFFRKKAGQQILREIQSRRSGTQYALAKGFATIFTRVLFPMRRFLNSYVPMPGLVYRIFFWASETSAAAAGAGTSCDEALHRSLL